MTFAPPPRLHLPEDRDEHLSRLTDACRDIANGMAVLGITTTRAAEEINKRLAALEREARGVAWPQVVLLLCILVVLIVIAFRLPH